MRLIRPIQGVRSPFLPGCNGAGAESGPHRYQTGQTVAIELVATSGVARGDAPATVTVSKRGKRSRSAGRCEDGGRAWRVRRHDPGPGFQALPAAFIQSPGMALNREAET